jgi:hypothetical protein
MSIPFHAGRIGVAFLEKLYKGKSFIGKQSVKAADLAAKKGYVQTSKAITGISQKGNVAIKWSAKKAKEYPKIAAAIGGAATIKFLDD